MMDSPMFAREHDGRTMVAGQLRRIEAECGGGPAIQPGIGYLTFADLDEAAASIGMRPRFVRSRGPLRWRLGRGLTRISLGRAPAAFGVWVAR